MIKQNTLENNFVSEGQLIIIFEGYGKMKPYYVSAAKIYQNAFGAFPVKDWIGQQYGTKVYAKQKKVYQPPQEAALPQNSNIDEQENKNDPQITKEENPHSIQDNNNQVSEQAQVVYNSTEIAQRASNKRSNQEMVSQDAQKSAKKAQRSQQPGWIYLLRPTPNLWTEALPHRTQVLYLADISIICAKLQLSPGKVVLESGTGSGSLTHSLASCISPNGMVRTFEFHQQRAEEATTDFQKNGLQSIVEVECRNIEEQGFPTELKNKADAVFLDLPGPWKAVKSSFDCLKHDGKLCTFSPCIEQVQQTCAEIREHRFVEIETIECLLRPYRINTHYERSIYEKASTKDQNDIEDKEQMNVDQDETKNQSKFKDPSSRSQIKLSQESRGHTGFLTFATKNINNFQYSDLP